MIKFFRKTRQRLLTENKFSKYLLYAIGEIVLVVIGILIALSINNWNENRMNLATKRYYVERLAEEIKADIQYYKELRKSFLTKEKRLNRITEIWRSNSNYIPDSLQYINDFFQAANISTVYKRPVVWSELTQNGQLKLIQDKKLSSTLISYHSQVEIFSDNFVQHPLKMIMQARERQFIPFLYEDPDSYSPVEDVKNKPHNKVYERIWNDREEFLKLYLNIAKSSKAQAQFLQEIIQSGQNLLEQLESK